MKNNDNKISFLQICCFLSVVSGIIGYLFVSFVFNFSLVENILCGVVVFITTSLYFKVLGGIFIESSLKFCIFTLLYTLSVNLLSSKYNFIFFISVFCGVTFVVVMFAFLWSIYFALEFKYWLEDRLDDIELLWYRLEFLLEERKCNRKRE